MDPWVLECSNQTEYIAKSAGRFECVLCQRKFRSKPNIKSTFLLILKQRQRLKKQFIPQRLAYIGHLQEMHTTDRYKHKCDACSASFARSYKLKKHIEKCHA